MFRLPSVKIVDYQPTIRQPTKNVVRYAEGLGNIPIWRDDLAIGSELKSAWGVSVFGLSAELFGFLSDCLTAVMTAVMTAVIHDYLHDYLPT